MNARGARIGGGGLARCWRAAGLALLVLLSGCAEVVRPPLAVGMNTRVGFDPLVLARDRGLVDPGRIKVVELASGTEVQRALNNGLLDAAALTLDETLRLADAGIELRIVALLNVSQGADVVMARQDIRSPRDLRGETVAVEDTSVGALLLQRMLGKTGLRRGDVRVVNLEATGHLEALREGRVAAAASYAPLASSLLAAGYVPIFGSDEIPGEVVDVLAVRASALRDRPEAVDELLRAWAAGLEDMNRDTTRAAALLARGSGLSTLEYLGVLKDVAFLPLPESMAQLTGPSVAFEARARSVGGALMDVGLLHRMPLLVDMVDTSALKRVLAAPGQP